LIGISNQDKSVKSIYKTRNKSYNGRFGNVCTLINNYSLKIGTPKSRGEDSVPDDTEHDSRNLRYVQLLCQTLNEAKDPVVTCDGFGSTA
jgi:hypothetical protein